MSDCTSIGNTEKHPPLGRGVFTPVFLDDVDPSDWSTGEFYDALRTPPPLVTNTLVRQASWRKDSIDANPIQMLRKFIPSFIAKSIFHQRIVYFPQIRRTWTWPGICTKRLVNNHLLTIYGANCRLSEISTSNNRSDPVTSLDYSWLHGTVFSMPPRR